MLVSLYKRQKQGNKLLKHAFYSLQETGVMKRPIEKSPKGCIFLVGEGLDGERLWDKKT